MNEYRMKDIVNVRKHEREKRKWDLLEGPKGRFGWGHHPYTLRTSILRNFT